MTPDQLLIVYERNGAMKKARLPKQTGLLFAGEAAKVYR
jgi:hypothetical protein